MSKLLKKDILFYRNRWFLFSIKKVEDCLFSRRNGFVGIKLFSYSILFLKMKRYKNK